MPVTNLKQFNNALTQAIKRNNADVEKFIKVTGLEALRRVVLKTPVLTGRARGNWQVGINDPMEEILDRLDPTGNIAIAEGSKRIDSSKGFNTINISNNLPYILPLENGSSQKAPNGMVAITLQELKTAL